MVWTKNDAPSWANHRVTSATRALHNPRADNATDLRAPVNIVKLVKRTYLSIAAGINREPAHVPLMCFASEADALAAKLEEGVRDSKFVKVISGAASNWKFAFSETPDTAPAITAGGGFTGSSGACMTRSRITAKFPTPPRDAA